MVETPETERATTATNDVGDPVRMSEVKAWFIREVLPLESVLMEFLSRGVRSILRYLEKAEFTTNPEQFRDAVVAVVAPIDLHSFAYMALLYFP